MVNQLGRTILVVEDESILLQALVAKLTHAGYEVFQATDGGKGLKIALHNHPDLILLDIVMPKVDGMTMLHKLREDAWGKSALVIILTNLNPGDEVLSKVIADQPSFYLMKSGNTIDQILEKINEVLEAEV